MMCELTLTVGPIALLIVLSINNGGASIFEFSDLMIVEFWELGSSGGRD